MGDPEQQRIAATHPVHQGCVVECEVIQRQKSVLVERSDTVPVVSRESIVQFIPKFSTSEV